MADVAGKKITIILLLTYMCQLNSHTVTNCETVSAFTLFLVSTTVVHLTLLKCF